MSRGTIPVKSANGASYLMAAGWNVYERQDTRSIPKWEQIFWPSRKGTQQLVDEFAEAKRNDPKIDINMLSFNRDAPFYRIDAVLKCGFQGLEKQRLRPMEQWQMSVIQGPIQSVIQGQIQAIQGQVPSVIQGQTQEIQRQARQNPIYCAYLREGYVLSPPLLSERSYHIWTYDKRISDEHVAELKDFIELGADPLYGRHYTELLRCPSELFVRVLDIVNQICPQITAELLHESL